MINQKYALIYVVHLQNIFLKESIKDQVQNLFFCVIIVKVVLTTLYILKRYQFALRKRKHFQCTEGVHYAISTPDKLA